MFGWAAAVYFLCFLASACCGWLLVRSYLKQSHQAAALERHMLRAAGAEQSFPIHRPCRCLPTMADLGLLRAALGLSAVSALLYRFYLGTRLNGARDARFPFRNGDDGVFRRRLVFFPVLVPDAGCHLCLFQRLVRPARDRPGAGDAGWLPGDDRAWIYLLQARSLHAADRWNCHQETLGQAPAKPAANSRAPGRS